MWGRAPIMRNRPSAGTVSSVPARAVPEHELLEVAGAATVDDLGPEADLDVRRRFHLSDEVLRHPGGERGGTDQQGDACDAYRERWSAACPAEFAPPITYASRPAIPGASDAVPP